MESIYVKTCTLPTSRLTQPNTAALAHTTAGLHAVYMQGVCITHGFPCFNRPPFARLTTELGSKSS